MITAGDPLRIAGRVACERARLPRLGM